MRDELLKLIALWRDKYFWEQTGAAMDSLDCADALESVVLGNARAVHVFDGVPETLLSFDIDPSWRQIGGAISHDLAKALDDEVQAIERAHLAKGDDEK